MSILKTLDTLSQNGAEHVRRDFEAGQEAAKALGKALNGGHRATIALGFLKGLTREHRYLQSEVIWALLQTLAELGGDDLNGRTDARNEHAIKACVDLREALKDRLPLA